MGSHEICIWDWVWSEVSGGSVGAQEQVQHYAFVSSAGAYVAGPIEPEHVEGDARKASAGHVEVETYLEEQVLAPALDPPDLTHTRTRTRTPAQSPEVCLGPHMSNAQAKRAPAHVSPCPNACDLASRARDAFKAGWLPALESSRACEAIG